MAFYKCKMCGGTIEFEAGDTIGVCDSCGTRQTLPRLDDDRRANLYDRANHFRRNNEFDKAARIYEQILEDDVTDAEAYWSLVLCRYGIEYVEDTVTHKRVPTVNRTQYTSIFDDENYKSALNYADSFQQAIYKDEATAINDIQKGILSISQKEKPFDVFICYKETDQNGRRTQDSVLANELYHQLTQEGLKVFFSRITLEDKLGTAYEPYIFAALNSAKVMVVLGTKPEYFNAVWVKNEWSRFLTIVKQSGGKKVLIPAYRDMDPYDLPEEFSHLQALDMSKLGFMQDLIRGIRKIINANEPGQVSRENTPVNAGNTSAAPLLRRAFMFLEDEEWDKADEFCEQVLNIEPENAQAYLAKLMAELEVSKQEDLQNCEDPFDDSYNFEKAIRFGDENLSSTLKGYVDYINNRNENIRITGIYDGAVKLMKRANSESEYKSAAASFKTIAGFKDSDALAKQCTENAEISRKDAIYANAKSQMKGIAVTGYEAAISAFQTIPGWKDADEQVLECRKKIDEINAKTEEEKLERERKEEEWRIATEIAKKRRNRLIAIVATIIVIVAGGLILLFNVIIPRIKLNRAMELINSGDYESAYVLLEETRNNDIVVSSKYNRAMSYIDSGDYEAAYALLEEIEKTEEIASNKYNRALESIDSGDYETAYILLDGLGYKDSAEIIERIKLQYQRSILTKANVGDYIVFGTYEQDNKVSNGKENIEWLVLAKEGNRVLVISRYALDSEEYEPYQVIAGFGREATWEDSHIRYWLNETFIDSAFSSEELEMIDRTMVTADKNPKYKTSPGNNTTDRVFLLSIQEANNYFSSDNARQCQRTPYDKAQVGSENDNCTWWLRSPGTPRNAACVNSAGEIDDSGQPNIWEDAVRPAMWINLGL